MRSRLMGWVSGAVVVAIAAVLTGLSSCAPKGAFSYRQEGSVKNATLAVKDYEVKGMVVVKSTKKVKGDGQIGSEITYEMLMAEVLKLGADEIINLKIDVKESVVVENAVSVKVYEYIGIGLAIKYTDAIGPGSERPTQSSVVGALETSVADE